MRLTPVAAEIDTERHPAFPVLSAGNFAEVAPERVSIISWSLLGDPVERGLRDLAARIWPRATWYSGSHYVFVAYVACRPYHNVSAFCHMARHIAGLEPRDVTANYFQDMPPVPSPPGLLASSAERALSLPRVARELFRLGPRLSELEGLVAQLEGQARLCLARRNPVALGETFAFARRAVDDAWTLHYLTTMVLVPLQSLLRALGDRVTEHWAELEPWIVEPDEVVWPSLQALRSFDQPLGPAEFLDHAFYEIADDREPWQRFVRPGAALTAHREAEQGPSPTHDAGLGRRVRARRSVWDIEPGLRRGGLPQVARLFADTVVRREATKSLAMRSLHVCRRLIPAVAEAVGVDDEAWPYLTAAELGGMDPPDELAARAQRRRLACSEALQKPAPEVLDDRGGQAPRRDSSDAVRVGRGVSPGVAVGVVVDDPRTNGEASSGPRILVCDSADAEIQPVLPLVDGVITARGSALSHVSILVREHGIPAVVGHPLALELKPGQLVRLNGTTGEVSLVD